MTCAAKCVLGPGGCARGRCRFEQAQREEFEGCDDAALSRRGGTLALLAPTKRGRKGNELQCVGRGRSTGRSKRIFLYMIFLVIVIQEH